MPTLVSPLPNLINIAWELAEATSQIAYYIGSKVSEKKT